MAMGLYEPAFATLTGLYGRTARGPITGITLIAGFASTVGWPLSAFLEAHYGWRETCFIWAALHIVMGLPLNRLLIPPAPPPQRSKAARRSAAGATLGDADPRLCVRHNRLCDRRHGGASAATARDCRRKRDDGDRRIGAGRPGASRRAPRRIWRLAPGASAGVGAAVSDPASARCGNACPVRTGCGDGLCRSARRRQWPSYDCARDGAARDLRADRLRPAHRAARRAGARDASRSAFSVRHTPRPHGGGIDRDLGRPVPRGISSPCFCSKPAPNRRR